jgi:hypothetical protein
MAYGTPGPGDVDMRPSHAGEKWSLAEVEVYKRAVLWLALREHVPNTRTKLEDVFVGRQILAWFKGNRDEILAQTRMETRTDADLDDCNQLSITGAGEFTMMVGVDKDHFRLDPSKAIGIPLDELIKLAGKPLPTAPDPTGILEEPVFAPRWPTVVSDAFDLMASWDEPPFAQKITTCLQNGPLRFAQLVAADQRAQHGNAGENGEAPAGH